jgi:hypothetical protein
LLAPALASLKRPSMKWLETAFAEDVGGRFSPLGLRVRAGFVVMKRRRSADIRRLGAGSKSSGADLTQSVAHAAEHSEEGLVILRGSPSIPPRKGQ